MSAFIVKDRTINQVIAYLKDCEDTEYIRRFLAGHGFNLSTNEGRLKLAGAMFKLNCQAIEERYGSGEVEKFRPIDFKYEPVLINSAVQAYKSLSCWLYQCSEGDIPRESPLFRIMDQIKSDLARQIVSNLKEYDQAEWD